MSTEKQKPLLFAHIGDLHITTAKEQNYKDLLSIVSQLAVYCNDQLDFVVLPGDNADNGLSEQYQLIAPVLRMLTIPVHILAGDHDMEQGSLANFYSKLAIRKLPYKVKVKGINCIFLDVCGPGSGGPDFRLGAGQLENLEEVLIDCTDKTQPCIIFMHTYPDDLKDEQEKQKLLQLINEHDIALVDMGHTHYNDISNSGKTVYTTTRSTGQIEEGPVGYSITSIDNGAISWRFRTLDDPFPFVMITTPSDYRLHRGGMIAPAENVEVRATVLGTDTINQVNCIIGDGQKYAMNFNPDRGDWTATIPYQNQPTMKIYVEAISIDGRPGRHFIEIPTPLFKQEIKGKDGSDELSIGAWPENGIPGTKLGPNRNAKPKKKKDK